MKQAVCVILINGGKILGVSRKDNHSDMGLPGGKVDADDPSVEHAMIREAREETGLDIYNLTLIDTRVWGGYHQHCFTAEYRGCIHYDQATEGVVEWVSAERLIAGSFGAYNGGILASLGLTEK